MIGKKINTETEEEAKKSIEIIKAAMEETKRASEWKNGGKTMIKIKNQVIQFSIERAESWEQVFKMVFSKVSHVQMKDFVELTIRPYNIEIKHAENG